jgi:putative nucleotidyltransferase with HDIG domain
MGSAGLGPPDPPHDVTSTSQAERLTAILQESIFAGGLRLPVLPAVAAEVLGCIDGDDCDAHSLAELIQRDPSLAANLLRIANSARFAPREPIVSLNQAISRLGLATLREIALTVAVKGAVFDVPGHEDFVAGLWHHAQATGRLSQEIARARRDNVEAAFLCGLLHDIGSPVILQGLVDVARREGCTIDSVCIEHAVDELHGAVGAKLVEEWKLPDWTREAVLHHHNPAGASAHNDLVNTVALGDALSDWLLEDDGEGERPGAELLRLLDLYDEDVDALCAKGPAIVRELAA